MNLPASYRLGLVLLTGMAAAAHAQTTTWIAQGNLATFGDWNDPGHWAAGTVPNAPTFVAVVNQVTPASRNPEGPYVNADPANPVSVPGGALPIITGDITLATLRFDLPEAASPYTAAVYVGSPGGAAGSLRLEGGGLDLRLAGTAALPADVNVTAGSRLTLANQAGVARAGLGRLNLYLGDGASTPANPARLLLQDDASLDMGTPRWLTVHGRGASSIVFQDRARAGFASFRLEGRSTIEFHNTASADQAEFRLGGNSLLLFDGQSTAGSSNILITTTDLASNSVIVRFAGQSSAGQSSVTSTMLINTGSLEFTEQATGGNAVNFTGRRLDISGAAAAGGTTGRQRASSSTLPPTGVIADDTRTITLKSVDALDVLLGSNTLEIQSGRIFNLRDSGGAYLSSAGENLVGGGLVKVGTGALYLHHPAYFFDPATFTYRASFNVISGPTVVRAGSLHLSNRLASVTVEPAGTLELSYGGNIQGQLVNAGRLATWGFGAPNAVTGDFTQTATGTFDPNVASFLPGLPAQGGLAVTGTATLGGRLVAGAHPRMFAWQPGTVEIQVLSAAAITGRFDTLDVSTNPARIQVTPTYSATGLNLRYEMRPFAALAAAPAGNAFASYLDAVYTHDPYRPYTHHWIGDQLSLATDAGEVAATLSALAPDRYGAVLEHGFSTALARRTTLDRVAGGNHAAAGSGRGALFAEGSRRRLTFAAVDGLPGARSVTDGWLAGGRIHRGPWAAGAYVAAEKTALSQDDAGSGDRIRSIEPGAFLRFDRGPWFAHASASISRDRHELRRFAVYSAGSDVRSLYAAEPRGGRTDLALTAGRTWQSRTWSLSPFAGVVRSRWRLDDFTETPDQPGPYAALAIEGWASTSLRVRAGLEAIAGSPGGRLQARLAVAGWRETEEDRSIPTRFAGASARYLAPGRPADQTAWLAAFDVSLRIAARAWLTAATAVQRGDHTRSSADLSAGLRWEF